MKFIKRKFIVIFLIKLFITGCIEREIELEISGNWKVNGVMTELTSNDSHLIFPDSTATENIMDLWFIGKDGSLVNLRFYSVNRTTENNTCVSMHNYYVGANDTLNYCIENNKMLHCDSFGPRFSNASTSSHLVSQNGTLSITKCDISNHRVSGTFNFSVIDKMNNYTEFKITEGSFRNIPYKVWQ